MTRVAPPSPDHGGLSHRPAASQSPSSSAEMSSPHCRSTASLPPQRETGGDNARRDQWERSTGGGAEDRTTTESEPGKGGEGGATYLSMVADVTGSRAGAILEVA